jgi:D-lactate dehydrogenase (cytochrome)
MSVETTNPMNSTGRDELLEDLRAIVGAEGVRDDLATRELFSEDIWSAASAPVALVVSPRSMDEIQGVVRAASAAGVAIAPRGAGMSYTGSYIPTDEATISLDLSRMNRVVKVSGEDMTVTVEPGCTWAMLHETLKAMGLRTPFWGPMSGLASTVGGGISQLNAMLGAGHYGTSSESVVALTMVLADGSILRSGARGPDGDTPFYRHYGPDLTGLFCGDSGVFGVKAQITLRLIRDPEHEGYASFSFVTGETLLEAMAEMARAGVASETCGFDPGLTRVRMKRASLASDVKTLGAVVAREKSLGKGLMAAAKVAMGGRNFVPDDDYSLHIIAEGRSAAGVEADLATARKIAADHAGREIENTIARVIRAVPFPPLNSMLGPEGEAWVPVHGMVSLSNAAALFAALQAMFAEFAPQFERESVSTGYLFTTVSTNAVTIEPVFFWPDARRPIHESAVEPAHLARLPKLPPNPAAKAVVAKARRGAVEVFERFGCGHFQIGRSYPYRESRDAASVALLDAIKHAVDPASRMNPGGLGFPTGAPTA